MKPTNEQIERVAKWVDSTLPAGGVSLLPHFVSSDPWRVVGIIAEACRAVGMDWYIELHPASKRWLCYVGAADGNGRAAESDLPAHAAILAVNSWLKGGT